MAPELILALFFVLFVYSGGNAPEAATRRLVLIAGAQKSGTTVLSALLANHSEIYFPRQKELHYFDRTKSYQKGIDYYWSRFNNSGTSEPYWGESTPFYLASRHACKRIAESVPQAKLLILLRNPVQRAYSEYQMKVRRVQEQQNFIKLMEENANDIFKCFSNFNGDYAYATRCVTSEVSEHAGWPKFINALKKAFTATNSWTQILESCFPLQLSLRGQTDSLESVKIVQEASSSGLQIANHLQNLTSISSSSAANCSGRIARFEPNVCWKHSPEGIERVKSFREAFLGEIESFKTCSIPILNNTAPSLWRVGGLEEAELIHTLDLLNEAVDACVRVKGGISSQYFYRSLYAVQLHHCFKHIPRDQILIIPSALLKRSSPIVLQSVLDFLEIKSHATEESAAFYSSLGGSVFTTNRSTVDVEVEQISGIVQNYFPKFASSTGWRIISDYPPLPEYMAKYMEEFFAPHNQLLFSLLNRNLSELW